MVLSGRRFRRSHFRGVRSCAQLETAQTHKAHYFETLQKTSSCRLGLQNRIGERSPVMMTDEDLEVRSCGELSAGEEIEAWHRGRLAHRGTVASTLEEIDLFWIIDARTGARRLLDLEQLSVRRIPVVKPAAAVARRPAAAVGDLPPGAAAARKPAAAVAAAKRKPAAAAKSKPAANLRQIAFIEAG
jgi:hypothetical protein